MIRTFSNDGSSRRRYLKAGDVILPTGLPLVYEVMTLEDFDGLYEPVP